MILKIKYERARFFFQMGDLDKQANFCKNDFIQQPSKMTI